MNRNRATSSNPRRNRGFNLVELMIVVVIIGILAAIGFPSYQNYMRNARRTAAQADVQEAAAALERFFSDTNTYVGFPIGDGGGSMFPDHSPSDQAHAARHYDIAVVPAATTYTITATTVSDAQNGDGALQFTSIGAKAWDKNDDGDFNDSGETGWDH